MKLLYLKQGFLILTATLCFCSSNVSQTRTPNEDAFIEIFLDLTDASLPANNVLAKIEQAISLIADDARYSSVTNLLKKFRTILIEGNSIDKKLLDTVAQELDQLLAHQSMTERLKKLRTIPYLLRLKNKFSSAVSALRGL